MIDVLVLGGGDSPERDVSLRSAKAVAEAARQAGFNVKEADPKDGFGIFDNISKQTIVLPILHGKGGEDGLLQVELEKRGLPYLGSNSESSANCFDKWKTRQILEATDIKVAEGELVSKENYLRHNLAASPHVLKVNHGGSSIGTLIVREPGTLNQKQLNELFELENEAVIEELINGIEATVPILDQSALTPLEIVPPEGLEFDYENKYNGMTQEICPPVSISSELQAKLMALAEQVHKAMNCRHLSRVDIMLPKDAQPVVLEINTIPGLTDQSLYPKSAAVNGLPMPDLVRKFVEMVKRDFSL